MNSKNSFLINKLSKILEYEQLKIVQVIEELEKDQFTDPILIDIILNHVFPGETRKMIIKDLKKYGEKVKKKIWRKEINRKIEEILEIVLQ
ncbi:MAG: hypothetical protein LBB45_07775 [Methanobrevibacter sp.]|jgi:hypothetical protein|nr:hypothetical protein [Candidatus Methanovirga basalitermitum]